MEQIYILNKYGNNNHEPKKTKVLDLDNLVEGGNKIQQNNHTITGSVQCDRKGPR